MVHPHLQRYLPIFHADDFISVDLVDISPRYIANEQQREPTYSYSPDARPISWMVDSRIGSGVHGT